MTMNKIYCALAAICLSITGLTAQNNNFPKPQLSASTQQYLWRIDKEHNGTAAIMNEYVYKLDASGNVFVSTLIKVQPGFNASALTALGVHIGTKAGYIWTAQVPLNNMHSFTQLSGIQYIEMDQPSYPSLDTARKATRVDSVHNGYGMLPQPYSGQGVVVGII